MTSLSEIVRPFQTRQVTPAEAAPSSDGATPPADTIITLGGSGGIKTCDNAFDQTITYYTKHKPIERKANRKTHKKKITSSKDPTEFLEVEVVDKFTTYDPANRGQEIETTLKNDDDDNDDDLP